MKLLVATAASLALLLSACDDDDATGPGSDDTGFSHPHPNAAMIDDHGLDYERICARLEVGLTSATPTVAVVVDRSGSMTRDFGGVSRWQAVYRTLMHPDVGLIARLSSEVRFGMLLYNSEEGFEGPACPILYEVLPALDNYAAIDEVYAPLRPSQDTPTGPALHAAIDSLAQIDEVGPKVIVLATDGMPDTCELPDPDGHEDAKFESVAAAHAGSHAGVGTFVISVGNEISEVHLQEMANAGAGLPLDSINPAPFYRAMNGQELFDAFEEIIDGVRECTFAIEVDGPIRIDENGEGYALVEGLVTLNGRVLGDDEWELREGEYLEILGAACEDLMAGGDDELAAEFTCVPVIM